MTGRSSGTPRARRRPAANGNAAGAYVLPPTVSRPALLENGSDRRFRTLVSDLLTLAARMELVRGHHGRRLGIPGPQYSLLAAVAHLQGASGISVGALAQVLHVSSAFVASESGKLARRGFLIKRTNPLDRRGVLLSVAPAGRLKLDRLSAEIRMLNDLFFGAIDARAFVALSAATAALVESSAKAVRHVEAVERKPSPMPAAAAE